MGQVVDVRVCEVSGVISVESRCAGFRLSIEMVSVQLLGLIVKCLAARLMIGYGPW